MRPTAALTAATLTLAACAGGTSTNNTIARQFGAGNAAALEAAAACDLDNALSFLRGAADTDNTEHLLFNSYAEAAVLQDMGQPQQAAAVLENAAADPDVNPGQRPVSDFEEGAALVSGMIDQQRMAVTGSPDC